GDVVRAIGGGEVRSLAGMFRRIWSLGQAGVEIPIRLDRDGNTLEQTIVSADRLSFFKAPPLHLSGVRNQLSIRPGIKRFYLDVLTSDCCHPLACTALPTNLLPSDHMAPGTRWVAAITSSKACSIRSQSSSVMIRGGKSFMVWLACPATWVSTLWSLNSGIVTNWQNSPLFAVSRRFQLALSFNELGGPNSIPIIRPLPRTARTNS